MIEKKAHEYLKLTRYALIICIIACLSSCSLFSPVSTKPLNKYLLNKIPTCSITKKPRSTILLVPLPETRPVYNTTQMAYRLRPYQIAYFSQNEWAETPAHMLHSLLVQTLTNTGYFKAIVEPPYGGRYDYTLNTEILEILQDYSCKTPVFIISVRAQIIKTSTNQVINTRQFSVIQAIPQGSPYGGVFAGNRATAQILESIAEFCLEIMHK